MRVDPLVMSTSILGGLLPAYVRYQESRSLVAADRLLAMEREFVRSASPERVQEFATGRVCARGALAGLGMEAQPILVSPDRSPIWPSGCVGSITHTEGYCAAVAARVKNCAALGIDAERIGRIEDDLLPLICTSSELATLPAAVDDRNWQMTAIFCAKEAYYKAQFALTKQWLEFSDVEISVGASRREFMGRVANGVDAAESGVRFEGAFGLMDDLLIAAVCIPPNEDQTAATWIKDE